MSTPTTLRKPFATSPSSPTWTTARPPLVDAMLRQSGTFRSNEAVAERVWTPTTSKKSAVSPSWPRTPPSTTRLQDRHRRYTGHADFGRRSRARPGVVRRRSAAGRHPRRPSPPRPATSTLQALEDKLATSSSSTRSTVPTPASRKSSTRSPSLFIDLDADESILDFPVIYTNGKLKHRHHGHRVPGTNLQPSSSSSSVSPQPRHAADDPLQDPRHQPRLLRLPRRLRHRPRLQRHPHRSAPRSTSRIDGTLAHQGHQLFTFNGLSAKTQ